MKIFIDPNRIDYLGNGAITKGTYSSVKIDESLLNLTAFKLSILKLNLDPFPNSD